MGRNGFSQDDFTYLVATKTTSRPLTAAERRAPKRKLGLKKRKKELSPYDRSVDITQLLFDNPPLIGKPLLKKKKKGLRKKVSLPEYMLDLPAVAKKKVILGNDGTPATQETDFSLDDWASLTMAEIETVREQALAASRRENKIFGPDSLKLTRSRSRLKALGFGTPAKKSRKFRDLVKRTMSPAAQKRASLATRRELRRMKTASSDFPLIADRQRNRLARALKRERITIQGEIIRKIVDGKKQFIVRAVAAEAPMVELLVDSLKLRTPVVIEIVDGV